VARGREGQRVGRVGRKEKGGEGEVGVKGRGRRMGKEVGGGQGAWTGSWRGEMGGFWRDLEGVGGGVEGGGKGKCELSGGWVCGGKLGIGGR